MFQSNSDLLRVGLNAGGCHSILNTTFHQNPQFLIELEDSDDEDELCTCVVALMRKNHRQDLDNTDTKIIPIYLFTV